MTSCSDYTLRPYQETSINRIFEDWDEGLKKLLLVLPTGTGKTVVFVTIAARLAAMGERVLIIAHRDELIKQAADKLLKVTGMECDFEKANLHCGEKQITVGSIQTMRGRRLQNMPEFDTLIVDEAHHIMADGYQAVLERFPDAKVLGVTATAQRSDGKSLLNCFDAMSYSYTMWQAIRDGYLSNIIVQTIPVNIDLRKVKVVAGDWQAEGLGSALEPYLEQIADEMLKYRERKIVVFLPLVRTAKLFAEKLRSRGFRATEVDGESPDREEILRDFDSGKYSALCNAMLLTEGWDCPSVDCIVVLRPTKSRSLYIQMVGRGTRLFPGKSHLLLLDFLWLAEKYNPCSPGTLVDNPAAREKVENQMIAGVDMADLNELAEEAERDAAAEWENSLKKQIDAQKKKEGKLINALQYVFSIGEDIFTNYQPTQAWEFDRPTEKQLKRIEKAGISTDGIDSKGLACQLIDRLENRRKAGLSTPKQIRCLERFGYQHVAQWPFKAANSKIAQIKANGWRVPSWEDPAEYRPGDDNKALDWGDNF